MTNDASRPKRYVVALVGMARPDQLALVCVVYALGVVVALGRGGTTDGVLPGLAALLVVGVAVHYANEYADYETDARTTRTRYSGGSGSLHATGLDRAFAERALAVAGTTAVVVILALAAGITATLPPVALGLLATILVVGVAYSLGPRLAWRGLGELANATLGGLVLPLYGITVTGIAPTGGDALAFAPFALVVFANLLATQWPDRKADASVGKRTLAVALSVPSLRALYVAAAALGIGTLVALATTDLLPAALVALAVPTAAMLIVGAARYGRVDSPAVSVHAMVALAFAYVLAAACFW